jgi:RNA polymerase sigma factor (TIGR02999 family)
MDRERGEITRLASDWMSGDDEAFDRLIELVYDDLRRIAHGHLARGARRGPLDTTVLVHEAYIKLAAVQEGAFEGRAQFFAFCSKAMRHILIDYARRRRAAKRGGTLVRVPLEEDTAAVESDVTDLLAVEEALEKLERRNPRMARIAECRFFGGMSVPDTARALDTSTRTVEREWARARAYLVHALETPPGDSGTD